MKKHLWCLLLITALFTVACAGTVHPINELVSASDRWDKQTVVMRGYLCVDLFTVYVASSTECDEIKEEDGDEFSIPLVLTKEQMVQARSIKSGSPVMITGEFRIPPTGAIRMTKGILLGYFVNVKSLSPL